MKDLYSWMKDVLDFFDLRFHEMDKVKIEFKEIKVSYNEETIVTTGLK